jgi:hypothetical protein
MPFDGPGAEEQLGPDLHVGAAADGEPGDVRLLDGQLADRLDAPLAHRVGEPGPAALPATAGRLPYFFLHHLPDIGAAGPARDEDHQG